MNEHMKAHLNSRGAPIPIKKTVHSPESTRNYITLSTLPSISEGLSVHDYLIVAIDAYLRASSEEPLYRLSLPQEPIQTQIRKGMGQCTEVGGSL